MKGARSLGISLVVIGFIITLFGIWIANATNGTTGQCEPGTLPKAPCVLGGPTNSEGYGILGGGIMLVAVGFGVIVYSFFKR